MVLDRPCWRCDWVLSGDDAQQKRKKKHHNASCPQCNATISLHGVPYKKKSE